MAEKHKEKGLAVLAVNTHARETAEQVKSFAREKGLKHTLLQGGTAVAHKYGVYATPTTFFIDKAGAVVAREVGFDAAGLEAKIAALLARP
ncbi:MAG: TlpA family protein disulfide reductase [Planctomycetes bacterium]|nr:TlpA family protein disulfide reductase [Planctomycetota bacterium]